MTAPIPSIRIMRADREGEQALIGGGEILRILLWFTATGIKPLILLRFQKWLMASKLRVGHPLHRA